MIKILSDKELQLTMGKNGRELVQDKYEWKQIAQSIHDIYEELL